MEQFTLNSGGPVLTAVAYITLNGGEAVVCKWKRWDCKEDEDAAVFPRACLTPVL